MKLDTMKAGIDYTGAAIIVKYMGPTNCRGSRVKATCKAGSLINSWDYSVNRDANYRRAALDLAERYGWPGTWIGGVLPSGEYCYTMTD